MIIGGQGFSVLKCDGTAVADVVDAAAAAVAAVDASDVTATAADSYPSSACRN